MGPRGNLCINRIVGLPRLFVRAACGLLLALALVPTVAHAANGNANVETIILTPLSLVKGADLDYGEIAQQTTAGTVVMVPTASPTCTTTGGLVRVGTCQPAEFWGWGAQNQAIAINRPNVPLVLSNGTATMNISVMTFNGDPNLTYISGNPNANGVLRYRIASASGVFSFRLGGTLQVGANQAPGLYSATFSVSVNYQ